MAQVQPTQQIKQTQPVSSTNMKTTNSVPQLSKKPVAVQPVQKTNPQPVQNTTSTNEPTEEDVQAGQKWYSKWWVWAIVAVAIILVGGLVWIFFR